MDDKELNKIAVRRAEKKLGFYIHSMIYLIVNALLAGLNMLIYPQFWWFLFPVIGWGIGLLIHGLVVFIGRSIKDKLVESEIRHLRETR